MARAERLGFGRVPTDFKGERKLNKGSRPQILAASAQRRPVPPGGAKGSITRRLIHGDHQRTGPVYQLLHRQLAILQIKRQTFNGNRMPASRLTAHVPFNYQQYLK
jgi:hypothetical protein